MFKKCPKCDYLWPDRALFLADPDVELIGYQVNFGDLNAGLFLFNHNTVQCETTLALEAGLFNELHEGPMFEKRMTGSKSCPGHCLRESDVELCPNECECAYVRDILDKIRHWPKNGLKEQATE